MPKRKRRQTKFPKVPKLLAPWLRRHGLRMPPPKPQAWEPPVFSEEEVDLLRDVLRGIEYPGVVAVGYNAAAVCLLCMGPEKEMGHFTGVATPSFIERWRGAYGKNRGHTKGCPMAKAMTLLGLQVRYQGESR